MSSVLIVLILIILIIGWYRRRSYKLTLFERCGIVGPKPNFFHGHFLEIVLEKNVPRQGTKLANQI